MGRRSRSATHRGRPGAAGVAQRVLARFARLDPVPAGPLLLAFSGGPDSLALAIILRDLRPSLGREIIAVHVDHRLRAESEVEAARAASLAAALDLPVQCQTVDAGAIGRHEGVGIEEAARRERYLLLAAAVEATGASLVCLAHHEEDQAETVLLHLLRGAGLSGGVGMSEDAALPVPWWEETGGAARRLRLWRPLLSEPRSELRRVLEAVPLRPIEDPSNDDERLRRNAVRRRVLPCLEEVVPGASAALARFGRLAAADDELLEQLAEAALLDAMNGAGDLAAAALQRQPVALQRRMVRRWLVGAAPGVELSAERIEAVRLLALSGTGGRTLEIGSGVKVRARRGILTRCHVVGA